MDTFLNAGSTMVILCIIVACGFAARKLDMTGDAFDTALTKIVMNITCPAMILDSVLSNTDLPAAASILNILLISVLAYLVLLAASWLAPKLYRTPRNQLGAHQFTIAFGNTGFIGFAVVGAIVGSNAVLYASMYNIVFNLLVFSAGAYFITASSGAKVSNRTRVNRMLVQLRSPAMIACYLALALALGGVTDTQGIAGRTCSMLGAMTPPATMLVVGSTLAKYDFREMLGNWRVYPTALLRLIGAPLVFWLVGGLLTQDTHLLGVLALENGMPTATVGTMLCLLYGGDLKTMSQTTFVTTVLSVVTIPLVSFVFL